MLTFNVTERISTHAPLRGATHRKLFDAADQLDFYSRASARRDATSTSTAAPSASFLLTRLCEARPLRRASDCGHADHFYSRASARRDALDVIEAWGFSYISTHAPLRGATVASGYTLKATDISTHAPLRGATTTALPTPCSQTISTHAPLRGATATFST